MEDKRTDKELTDRWLEGDERAFDQLFQRYVHKLYLYTVEQIGNAEEAEELVMDVLLKVWQNKENCRNVRSMNAYLYGAVKNAVIDHYRKKALLTSALEDIYEEPLSEEQADAPLIDKEYQRLLNNALKQISPQCRLVFTLKRNKDMSNKEIAQHLNLSVKTVENHMSAAIAFLREYVNRKASLMIFLLVLWSGII